MFPVFYSKYPARRIVQSLPGPGTTNADDTLIDNCGGRWKRVTDQEASILNSGTAIVPVARLYPDGTIR
jgi:hypothetical protein